jgi:hypothetical protein
MAKTTAKSKRKTTKSAKTKRSTPGDANPLAGDKKLRALLKPLLPPGTDLSPLTFDQSYHPTAAEGIDPAMGLEARNDKVKLPFQKKEQEVVHVRLHALQALVPLTKASALVAKIQPRLQRHGYQAVVAAEHNVVFTAATEFEGAPAMKSLAGKATVAFFKADQPVGFLFACGTNGVNLGRGLVTSDIVRRLRQWAGECEYTLLGAGFDWVRLRFKTVPKDVARFGGEIYLLGWETSQEPDDIPDDVWRRPPKDQDALAPRIGKAFGLRSPEDLKRMTGPTKELFFWWD